LPALSKAKQKAKDIQCLSNEKQICLSMLMYIGDNGGKLIGYQNIYVWVNQLDTGYSAIKGVRTCPAAPEQNPWGTGTPPRSPSTRGGDNAAFGTADYPWSWVNWGKWNAQGSYGFNMWCYSDLKNFKVIPHADVDQYAFVKETAVVGASKTPLFADAVWVDFVVRPEQTFGTDLYSGQDDKGSSPPYGLGIITIARHGGLGASAAPRNFTGPILPGRNNMGFLDGHAEAVKLNDLKDFYWHKEWPR